MNKTIPVGGRDPWFFVLGFFGMGSGMGRRNYSMVLPINISHYSA